MSAHAKIRRRWFGAFCLLAGLIMLIAGETVLQARLSGAILIGYWLGCFIFTALAAGTALIDAARVRAENRNAQRTLIASTLQEIEHERRSRQHPKG